MFSGWRASVSHSVVERVLAGRTVFGTVGKGLSGGAFGLPQALLMSATRALLTGIRTPSLSCVQLRSHEVIIKVRVLQRDWGRPFANNSKLSPFN